jgi:uncharacterized protein YcbK (DUF882 family)
MDVELLGVLERIRWHFNSPITITSGCRCESHNKRVGGAENSMHTKGLAADIKVKGAAPDMVYGFLNKTYPDKYGIGLYNNWTHIDVRKNKARWGK